jgi:hypothetical protein
MNIFEPLTTYASPFRTAVVWIPETSDPAPGSERPKQPRIGSETSGASHSCFCSSVPAMRIGPVRADRRPDAGAAPVELLADEHPVERRELGAAERLGEMEIHEAELMGLGHDLGRVRLVLVVLRRLRPDLLLGELAREGAELLLLVGEGERDPARDGLVDRGHVVSSRDC